MSVILTPQETLRRAAEIIQERGRAQVVMMTAKGCVCPLGAIALARGFSEIQVLDETEVWSHLYIDPAVRLLANHLGGSSTGSVWYWNDHMAITDEVVISKLLEVAKT